MTLNMTIKSLSLALIAVAALSAAPAFAKTSTPDFVRKVAVANKFEIDTSKVALDQSQDDGVKTFAQQMVDDHTKAGDAFTTALSSARTKAKAPDDLDKSHQALVDKLKAQKAASFDTQYIKLQLSAHKDAVKLFSDYSKTGSDPSLKKFAADTLPTLKEHLDHVTQLQKDYGAKK